MSAKLTGYVWDGCYAASGMRGIQRGNYGRTADFSNDEGVCCAVKPLPARLALEDESTVRRLYRTAGSRRLVNA